VPVLSDEAVTFFSSIIALTPNDNFLIVPLLHSVSDMKFAAMHEERFYAYPSVFDLHRLRLPSVTLSRGTGLNQRSAYT
jgi:hypothetical protein